MPPGARYLVLENCGHTPTWDEPEAVAELLLEASSAEADRFGTEAVGA
jgi:pimeloyl-ACP methyl ester carboxylesterase